MIFIFFILRRVEKDSPKNCKNNIIENITEKTEENHDDESDQEPDIEKLKALFIAEINKLINEVFSEEELGTNTLSETTSKFLKNSNVRKGQLKLQKVETLKGY